LDDAPEDTPLRLGCQATDGSCVALRELPAREGGLDRRIEVEEPQRVRDGRSRPPDPCGDGLMAVAEHVDELPIREGRLDRVEVLPLEVLDERELELLVVREL